MGEDIEIHVSNWTVFGEAYTRVYFENQHNVRQWLMLRNVTQSEVTAIEALFYENQGPQAEGDDFITQEDRPLQIAITDLLENDTDHEDGIPTFDSILEGPAHGTVEETGTGTLIYVPAANFHGHHCFTPLRIKYATNRGPWLRRPWYCVLMLSTMRRELG